MRTDCTGCKFIQVENLAISQTKGKYYKWFCKKAERVIAEFIFDSNPVLPVWCPLKKEAEDRFFAKGKVT